MKNLTSKSSVPEWVYEQTYLSLGLWTVYIKGELRILESLKFNVLTPMEADQLCKYLNTLEQKARGG